jgi:hypothetical protein
MVQILCTLYENGEIISVETFPGNGGEREMKENGGEDEFQYDIYDIL